METRKQSGRKLVSLRSEKGYVMLSTLFLLVLTGIFLQSVIKISANYIIQLNQLSTAYQAKTALNMSEKILGDYIIENNDTFPEQVELLSSVGKIMITKNRNDSYDATITQPNGVAFHKIIELEVYVNGDKEAENKEERLNGDPVAPKNEENIHVD